MPTPITIDGASGGGQMLRNAVALSAVCGRAVRVTNIRGARPRPGLRPQHVTAVRAAAEACGARLVGAEIGSREIEFWPGVIARGMKKRLDVGTAGSVALVLQCLLPALALAPRPSNLTLVGGTDVPFAPPFEYFTEVFAPAVAELGARVEARLVQRGFYPKGGGEVEVAVRPSPALEPISWTERGEVALIRGRAYSLGLPDHIVRRMRESAANRLMQGGYRNLDIRLEAAEEGRSEGCGIVLWAECEGGRRIGASALGERGKRAERVGEEAAESLLGELQSAAATDRHLADQLIVWIALAKGPSGTTTSQISDHVRSAVAVAEAVAGARFVLEEGRPARIRCEPRAV